MKHQLLLLATVLPLAAMAIEGPMPLRMERSSRGAGKGHRATTICTIYQNLCVNHPDRVGTLPDFDGTAHVVSSRCMQRPREFAQWCGNPPGVVTSATFSYPSGRGVSNSYVSTGTSCSISQNQCDLIPDVIGTFVDMDPQATIDPGRCMQRAREYSTVCANRPGVPTTATFRFSNGQQTSNTYFTEGTSCVITQGQCLTNPAQSGIFADAFDGSNTYLPRCFQRAHEYAIACGNPRGSVTTADFTYPSGQMSSYSYVVP